LTALIEHHFAEAHTLKAAAPGKQSSGAAAVAAAAFKADMLEYYRCIPVCYLRPLRAVVRKANTSAPVQIAMPEFREQQAEENSKGAENSKAATAALLPVVSLPPSLKARMEHVRLEKGRLFDKSLAPQATVSQGLDETMEVEGKQGSSVRRARGGTPALFESLAGPLGNYAGADTRSNKAALMVNPFNIPRGNLLVHVRRMRLAFLGHEHAGPMDKRPDSRHDRSTHSVPIADMGKFQEVLMRRAASGASTLRDPLLDLDEILRSPLASPFCLLPPPLDLKISSGKVIWCWVA